MIMTLGCLWIQPPHSLRGDLALAPPQANLPTCPLKAKIKSILSYLILSYLILSYSALTWEYSRAALLPTPPQAPKQTAKIQASSSKVA